MEKLILLVLIIFSKRILPAWTFKILIFSLNIPLVLKISFRSKLFKPIFIKMFMIRLWWDKSFREKKRIKLRKIREIKKWRIRNQFLIMSLKKILRYLKGWEEKFLQVPLPLNLMWLLTRVVKRKLILFWIEKVRNLKISINNWIFRFFR